MCDYSNGEWHWHGENQGTRQKSWIAATGGQVPVQSPGVDRLSSYKPQCAPVQITPVPSNGRSPSPPRHMAALHLWTGTAVSVAGIRANPQDRQGTSEGDLGCSPCIRF